MAGKGKGQGKGLGKGGAKRHRKVNFIGLTEDWIKIEFYEYIVSYNGNYNE